MHFFHHLLPKKTCEHEQILDGENKKSEHVDVFLSSLLTQLPSSPKHCGNH
jgi:hypothetical protein